MHDSDRAAHHRQVVGLTDLLARCTLATSGGVVMFGKAVAYRLDNRVATVFCIIAAVYDFGGSDWFTRLDDMPA